MDLDGGDNDYDYCDRDVTIKMAGAALHRTMLPLLRLKFNFSFKLETSNWTLTEDSPTLALTGESFSSEHQSSATVIIVGDSLSYNDAGAAIEEAVGDFLAEEERLELVEEAWSAAQEHLPAAGTLPMFGVLEVNFNVHVDEREVVVDGGGDGDGMVPAADSSLEILEKCKADCGGSCCICLEEFFGGVGGGGFRMPCLHVFHGGCIREWLRSSHYCPLCRYEMPTAAAEEKGDGFDEDDMCIC